MITALLLPLCDYHQKYSTKLKTLPKWAPTSEGLPDWQMLASARSDLLAAVVGLRRDSMKEGLRAAALLAWLCALLCWVPSSEAAEAEAASSWLFSKKAPKNPCKDEPCHVHALCMPLKNCPLLSFLPCRHTRLCKCLPPFEGDGEIVHRKVTEIVLRSKGRVRSGGSSGHH